MARQPTTVPEIRPEDRPAEWVVCRTFRRDLPRLALLILWIPRPKSSLIWVSTGDRSAARHHLLAVRHIDIRHFVYLSYSADSLRIVLGSLRQFSAFAILSTVFIHQPPPCSSFSPPSSSSLRRVVTLHGADPRPRRRPRGAPLGCLICAAGRRARRGIHLVVCGRHRLTTFRYLRRSRRRWENNDVLDPRLGCGHRRPRCRRPIPSPCPARATDHTPLPGGQTMVRWRRCSLRALRTSAGWLGERRNHPGRMGRGSPS